MSGVGNGDSKNAEGESKNVLTDEDEDFLLSLDQWDVVDEASGSEGGDTGDQITEEQINRQVEQSQELQDAKLSPSAEKETDVQAESDQDGCSGVITEKSKEDKEQDESRSEKDADQVVLMEDKVDDAEDNLGTKEGAASTESGEKSLGNSKNNNNDGNMAVAVTESSKEPSESSVLVSNFSLWPDFTVTIQNDGKEAGDHEFLTTEEGVESTNTLGQVLENEGLQSTETLAVASSDEVLESTNTKAVVDKNVETQNVMAISTDIDFQDKESPFYKEKIEASSTAGNVYENELLIISDLNDPEHKCESNYDDNSEKENINDNQMSEVMNNALSGNKDSERQISDRTERTYEETGQCEDDMEVENETKEEQMEVEIEDTKMSSVDGTENLKWDKTKTSEKNKSKVDNKVGDEEHQAKGEEEYNMEETKNSPNGKDDDDIDREEEDQKNAGNEDEKEGGAIKVIEDEEKMEETEDAGKEEVEEIEDGDEELEGEEEEEQLQEDDVDEAVKDKKEEEGDMSIDENNQTKSNKTEDVEAVEKAVVADKVGVEQTKGKLTKSVRKESVKPPRKPTISTEVKAGVKTAVRAEVKAEASREITTSHVLDLKMTSVTVDDLGSRDMILILKNALHFSVDFPGQPGSVKGIGTVTATVSLDRRHTSLKYLMKNLALLYFEGVQFPDLRQKYLECIGKECRAMNLQGIHPKQYSLFAYQLPKYTTREKLKQVFPNCKRCFLAYTRKGIGWAVLQFRTKEEPLRILQATGCEITLEKRAPPTSLSVVSLRSTEELTNPDFKAWFYDQKFNPGGRGWGPRMEKDNSKENSMKETAWDRNRKEKSLNTKQKLAYKQQLHKAQTKGGSPKTAKLQKLQAKNDSPKKTKLQKTQAKNDSPQTAKLSTIVSDRKQGPCYVAPSVRCLISVLTNVEGQTAPSSNVKGHIHVSPNIEIQTLPSSNVKGQTATLSKVKSPVSASPVKNSSAVSSNVKVKINTPSSSKAKDQTSKTADVKTKSSRGVNKQKALMSPVQNQEQETKEQACPTKKGGLKNNSQVEVSQEVLHTVDQAEDTKTDEQPTEDVVNAAGTGILRTKYGIGHPEARIVATAANIEAEALPTESGTIVLRKESDKKVKQEVDTAMEDDQVNEDDQQQEAEHEADEEPDTVKNEGVEELDADVVELDTEENEDVDDQETRENEGLDDTGEKGALLELNTEKKDVEEHGTGDDVVECETREDAEELDEEDEDVEELDTIENDEDDDVKLEAVEDEDEVDLDVEDDDVIEIDAGDDDVVELDAEDEDVVELDAEDEDVVELDAEDEDVVELDTGEDEEELDAEEIKDADETQKNKVEGENKAVKNAEENQGENAVDKKTNENTDGAPIAKQPTTQRKSGKSPRKGKTFPVRSSMRSPLKKQVSRKARPGLVKGEGAGAIYDNVSSCDSISPYDNISSDSEHDGLNRKESPRKKRAAMKGDTKDAQLENDSISSDSLPPEDLKKGSKGGWDYMRGVWDSVSGESVASANSELSDISSKDSKEKRPRKAKKGKSGDEWEDNSLSNVSDAESEGHGRLHSHKELSSKIHSALSDEKYKQSDSAMVALLRSALDVVVQSRERQSPSPPPKSSRVRGGSPRKTDPHRKYKRSPSPASYKRHGDSSPLRGRQSRSRSPMKKHKRSVTPLRHRSSPSPLRHQDSLSPKRLRESFSPQRRRGSLSPPRIRGSLSPPRRSFQSPMRDNYGKKRTSFSPVQDDRYRQRRDSQISREGVPRHGTRRHGLSPVSVSPVRDRYGRSSFSPGTSEYDRNMLDIGGHYRQRSPSVNRDTSYTRRRVSVSPVRTTYTRHRGSPSPERMASYRRARDSVSPVGRGYNRNRRSRSPAESDRRYNRSRRLQSPGAREYDRSRRSPSEESRRYDQRRRSPYSGSRGYDHSRRLLSPDSRGYDQSRRSLSPRTRSYDRSRRSLSSARHDSYDQLSRSSRSAERSYVRHRSTVGSLSDISQQSISRSASRSLSPISSRSRSPSVKRKHPYDDYAEQDAKKAKLNEPAAVPYTAPGYNVAPISSVVGSSYYPGTGYQQTATTYSQHPAMSAPGHGQYATPFQPPHVPPPPLLTQSRPPYMYSQPPIPYMMPHQLQQPPPPMYMSMQQPASYSSPQQPLVTVTTKKSTQPQRRQLIPVPEQGTQSASSVPFMNKAVGIVDPPRRILFVGDSLINQLSNDFVGQKQNLNLHQREFQIHCVGKLGGQVGDLEPPALNHTMNEIQPHNVFIQCGGDDLDSPNFNQIMTCLPTQLVSVAQRLVDGFGVLSVGIMQILPRLTTKHVPCDSYNKGANQVNCSIKSLCKNNDNIFFWNHKNLKNTDVTSIGNDGIRLTEAGMVKYFRSVRGVTLFVGRGLKKTNLQ
ncbi:nucleoprotein TPR-like [Mizuhopecten yessoensis]|uniref:Replicase polyprotein 1ab n=1 Tax=Mizuhopecten yessoensis TaxID=6573 RepID=A0A210PN29_MIZYE|nr:nucleoprotein TPR-like [Mizuhopecten yessoensis]OWF37888.1 Replicase polyprotein 1ab [Mizuhopecten yessoensis]